MTGAKTDAALVEMAQKAAMEVLALAAFGAYSGFSDDEADLHWDNAPEEEKAKWRRVAESQRQVMRDARQLGRMVVHGKSS